MKATLLLTLLCSYLAGGLPGGVVVCRALKKPDPRQQGSGNIGATNVWRVCGRTSGVATLLIDMGKGALPAGLALAWFGPAEAALAGLFAVVGHCWPIYLGFKGGKGVATALGALLVVAPGVGVACGLTMGAIGYVTGRMSVGSLVGCSTAWVLLILAGHSWAVVSSFLGVAVIVLWRHRENIQRLRNGQEHAW